MLWAPRDAGRLSYGQTELIHTIRRCGLTSGLKLCLDAGDANSYSSGQSWFDTSGNGYDFFLGATSGSEASDPTFNGTAGRRSSGEYWSFDGGDYFTYDSANETWMQNLHKDNAVFTLLAFVQPGGTGTQARILSDSVATVSTGVEWLLTTANPPAIQLFVGNGASTVLSTIGPTAASGSPHMVAVSLTEATGVDGGLWFVDGNTSTFTSTYTSPSTGAAGNTMKLGARGDDALPLLNTSRVWAYAAWEGVALTQSQLNALYMGTRGRLGV